LVRLSLRELDRRGGKRRGMKNQLEDVGESYRGAVGDGYRTFGGPTRKGRGRRFLGRVSERTREWVEVNGLHSH